MYLVDRKIESPHYNNKESGVVLVTVLIFLILILILLKFSLASSLLQEKKSGIDQDNFVARQSAHLALREAERYLMKYARDQLVAEGEIEATECLLTGNSPCTKEQEGKINNRIAQIWNPDKTASKKSLDASSIAGVYDGEQGNICKDNNNNNNYLQRWTCMNWLDNNAVIRYGTFTGTSVAGMETLNALPRYFIERFTAKQINSDLSNKIVVLRITAIGYGLRDTVPSRMILQATYAIKSS